MRRAGVFSTAWFRLTRQSRGLHAGIALALATAVQDRALLAQLARASKIVLDCADIIHLRQRSVLRETFGVS